MSAGLRLASHLGYLSVDEPLFRDSVGSLDPVAHIEFAARIGFQGVLYPWVASRPEEEVVRVAAALEKHEHNFDSGGIAGKQTWQPTTGETISVNEALMQALHIYGTPGLVFLDEHNEVKVFAGMPDPGQLRTILGKR